MGKGQSVSKAEVGYCTETNGSLVRLLKEVFGEE